MVRISYPQNKLHTYGIGDQGYCFKLSSPTQESTELAFKILCNLGKETETLFRATCTHDDAEALKKRCGNEHAWLNTDYVEKSRRKNQANMEFYASIRSAESLLTLLQNWTCPSDQSRSIFVTSPGGIERICVTHQNAATSSVRLSDVWAYTHGYLDCDPHAKWNTYMITVRKEGAGDMERILMSYLQ